MKILFVCLGNICRSPMADGIMIQLLKDKGLEDKVEVDSAGTEDYHVGELADSRAIKVSREHHVELLYHRARQITVQDLKYYDRIYTMATNVHEEVLALTNDKNLQSKVILFMDVISPGKNLSVPDPWYGTESGFIPVFELIDRGCKIILEDLEKIYIKA